MIDADISALNLAEAWIGAFATALAAGDGKGAAALFEHGGQWRDIVAFGWDIRTLPGRAAIAAMVATAPRARDIRIAAGRTAPRRVTRAGREVVEVLFSFATDIGTGHGVARLIDDGDWVLAWTVSTALEALHGDAALEAGRYAEAADYERDWGGPNWLDKRTQRASYADRDPAVLVIGAGQAGLGIAARLSRIGVDTLIVDRERRVGDNWRQRYHALTLHNEVHVNHLPYMPFPPSFPVFIPKDKLANWFEAYVDALDLNVWTGTGLESGRWIEEEKCWEVVLRRANGGTRVMRPRHLVFGTGVSSIPIMPEMPGLSDFEGEVMHSGAFTDGAPWRGRRVLVMGTGNSGHDVAQDLQASGAVVTMVQRSPTYVVSLREAQSVYAIYNEGIPIADCDLLATAMPHDVLRKAYQISTAASRLADRALHEGLEKRGFRLTFGEDETGFQMMYLRRGGGYYFNVGCSDLIVSGEIVLRQYEEIDRFVAEGALLKDGTVLPADLVVMATGYENQQETVRRVLGDAIAERVGRVWGFDSGGELANMWRPTGQEGLWFTAGSLAQCRIFSRFLAVQIKAREQGLVT